MCGFFFVNNTTEKTKHFTGTKFERSRHIHKTSEHAICEKKGIAELL